MTATLPAPGKWNAAVEHSRAHPAHILGPYDDDNGDVQMECMGSGDPYEPSNCDFDTGRADTMTAIYVCIGNSDDKLSQQDWHLFFSHVRVLAENHSDQVYGVWHSLPAERWQNACFGFGVSSPGKREFIRMRLGELAKQYGQDWISWTEAETETIKP